MGSPVPVGVRRRLHAHCGGSCRRSRPGFHESLLDQSLVRHRIDEAGAGPILDLDTIREYAQRELDARTRWTPPDQHTAYFRMSLSGWAATTYVNVRRATRPYPIRPRELQRSSRPCARDGRRRKRPSIRSPTGSRDEETGSEPATGWRGCAASIALPGAREDGAWALVRAARVGLSRESSLRLGAGSTKPTCC